MFPRKAFEFIIPICLVQIGQFYFTLDRLIPLDNTDLNSNNSKVDCFPVKISRENRGLKHERVVLYSYR